MAQSKFDRELEAALDSLAVGVGRVLPKIDDRVPRSAYRAGRQRLAGRLATLSAIGGTGHAYWQDPAATVTALEASALAYAVLGRQRRELMREWIDPLHQALAGPLGIPEQTHPRRYLHIPRDFSDDDAVIRIDLPVSLRFNQELVANLITRKLALEGGSMSWNLADRAPHVLMNKSHRPPNKFAFTDPGARELVAKTPESAPLIGLGSGRTGVAVDLDAESPHVLVSAGTGGGKSVILRTIACQLLHHGALVYVLDFKRISHLWARGVPGATYCRDIAEIHDALLRLGAEGRRRIRLADQLSNDPDADPADVGPRLAILLEEVNATMKQLALLGAHPAKRRPQDLPRDRRAHRDPIHGPPGAPARPAGRTVRHRPRPGRPGDARAVRHPHPGPLHPKRLADARPRDHPGPQEHPPHRPRPSRPGQRRPRDAGAVLHRRTGPRVGNVRHHPAHRHRPARPGAGLPHPDTGERPPGRPGRRRPQHLDDRGPGGGGRTARRPCVSRT